MHACGTDKASLKLGECNKVVHGLARSILCENTSLYCLEEKSEWLMKSIKSDMDDCNLRSY